MTLEIFWHVCFGVKRLDNCSNSVGFSSVSNRRCQSRLCVFNCVSLCQVLKTASQKDTEKGIRSVVSVKVTSDITAFCNASNNFGTTMVTFNIKTSEFLLLPAFPVSALCVYMCVRLSLLSSCPPTPFFFCSCLCHFFNVYFVWMPQAVLCAVMCCLWFWTF